MVSVSIAIAGCSGSHGMETSTETRAGVMIPGRFAFDMELSPVLTDSATAIDILLSLPPTSLTFLKRGTGFSAGIEINARAGRPESDSIVTERTWDVTMLADSYERTQSYDPYEVTRRLPVPSGRMNVEVTVEDRSSGRRDIHVNPVEVPVLGGSTPALGAIRLFSRSTDASFSPLVSFRVPAIVDSLRASVVAYNLAPGRSREALFQVTRLKADTAAALPPFWGQGFGTERGFQRLGSDDVDTVFRRAQTFLPSGSQTMLAADLPALTEGLYRIALSVGETDSPALVSHRLFYVMSRGFPRPQFIDDLVGPMRYLTTNAEMNGLRGGATPEQRRREFEELWLSFGGDRRSAAGLIRKFSTRVEEANRYFTTIKQGWKTDRGMVYIVLGPPGEIQGTVEGQAWYYGSSLAPQVFMFKRVITDAGERSFEDFQLVRQASLEEFWDSMVQRWRKNEAP